MSACLEPYKPATFTKPFFSLEGCQKHFDLWKILYNTERSHDALQMGVPADRYKPSKKSFWLKESN
jgi:transposase InsO family protein